MKKVKLKKPVIYGIYTGAIALLLGALYYVDFSNGKVLDGPKDNDDVRYVSRLFGSDDIPVVGSESVILRPYIDDTATFAQLLSHHIEYRGVVADMVGRECARAHHACYLYFSHKR